MHQVKIITSNKSSFHCFTDMVGLYESAILYWVNKCEECIKEKGSFTVVFSGGNTPVPFYNALALQQFDYKIPWDKVHVFFSDERVVPLEHADSNYRMVNNTLFKHIPIPKKNIYPMYPYPADLYELSQKYAGLIDRVIDKNSNGLPVFDLMLLGLGVDGHTASLFPGADVVEEEKHWVCPVYVKEFNSWRITMTLPVLNSSQDIMFLAVGEEKSFIISDVFHNRVKHEYPVINVTANNEIHWFIDSDAASGIID
ncbi:MAG: 6-phosphogluconolactonase [Pseudomonadota bacterium]